MLEGNYKWLQNTDGSITVLDVEIMGVLAAGERKDKAETVSREDLPAFLAKTLEIERKLKRRQTYLKGHNNYREGKAAPVIGHIDPDSRRVAGDWIVGSLVITEPDSIEKAKRGELPNRSPEFIKRGPNRGYMWALAATEGLPGHFDDRLPALLLEKIPLTSIPELATLSAEDEPATMALLAPAFTLRKDPTSPEDLGHSLPETGMALTKEDLDAIKGVVTETAKAVVKQAFDAELAPLREQVATLAKQADNDAPDLDAALSEQARKLVEGEMDALKKQRADNDLELARTKAMATLSAETHLTKAAIKKLIEPYKTDQLPLKVEALVARHGKKDVRLPDDATVAAHGEMAALAKEYEMVGGEKAMGLTQAQYCSMFINSGLTDGLDDLA